ncbi:hypothetical protein D3C75_621860 [compost metagenome]
MEIIVIIDSVRRVFFPQILADKGSGLGQAVFVDEGDSIVLAQHFIGIQKLLAEDLLQTGIGVVIEVLIQRQIGSLGHKCFHIA